MLGHFQNLQTILNDLNNLGLIRITRFQRFHLLLKKMGKLNISFQNIIALNVTFNTIEAADEAMNLMRQTATLYMELAECIEDIKSNVNAQSAATVDLCMQLRDFTSDETD